MKNIFKWLSLIAILHLLTIITVHAQNVSKTVLNISIAGIEYDDASFVKLRESIKTNKRAQDVKQSFSQNTAKLSLTYAGEAAEFWDELPGTIKQPFKIITIDGNRIELQLKNSASANTPISNAAKNTSSQANNDDCKNCYWNICNYDVLKSFGGKIYKGINEDDATHYYNCDNGVLIHKIVMVNANGVITSIKTDTLLISSGPIGTKWGVVNTASENGLLSIMTGTDLSMRNAGSSTLIAKNISTTANGKNYNDVIVVNYKGYSINPLFGSNFYSTNAYYAKGIGLVRTDTLNFNSDPIAAINKENSEKIIHSGGSVVKNGIDESIIGLWKYHDAASNKNTYYRFNADGTFECYENSVTEANKVKGIHKWKIEEGGYYKGVAIIGMAWAGGGSYVMRNNLEKKNDPVTGKPGLLLNGAMLISTDNKSPW